MARFNYPVFDEEYNKLTKIIGSGETDASTIVGVVNDSNEKMVSRLEYAENSLWASSKLNDWNEAMASFKTNLGNLEELLKAANTARIAYENWENEQASKNLVG